MRSDRGPRRAPGATGPRRDPRCTRGPGPAAPKEADELGKAEPHRAQVTAEEDGLGEDDEPEGACPKPCRRARQEGDHDEQIGPARADLRDPEQGPRGPIGPSLVTEDSGPGSMHADHDVRVHPAEESLMTQQLPHGVLFARHREVVDEPRRLVDLVSPLPQTRGQDLVLARHPQVGVVEAHGPQRLDAEHVAAALGEAHWNQLVRGVAREDVHQVRHDVQLLRQRGGCVARHRRLTGDRRRIGVAVDQLQHRGHVVLAPEPAVEVACQGVRCADESEGLVERSGETEVLGVHDQAIVRRGSEGHERRLDGP